MLHSHAIGLLAKGGPVMIPLLACSILSLAITVERAWYWARSGGSRAVARVLDLAGAGKLDDARHAARLARSPVVRVLAAGIDHRDNGAGLAMQAAASCEQARMRRYLPALETIVTLAPLLGLLGTVTGMIGAFGVMATGDINEPHAITGGVAEALIATAVGLAVAIATLVPYNYFSARAERALDEMERAGSELELVLAGERA